MNATNERRPRKVDWPYVGGELACRGTAEDGPGDPPEDASHQRLLPFAGLFLGAALGSAFFWALRCFASASAALALTVSGLR